MSLLASPAVTTRFECPRCQTVFTRDRGDDDAFVECPSCGAMAMSVGEATDALARQLSSTHDVGAFQDRTLEGSSDDDDDDSGVVHRPEPSLVGTLGAGVFSGLLGQPSDTAPPPPVGGLDLGLDEELRDFELPSTAPGNAALSPQKKTTVKPKKQAAAAAPAPGMPPPPRGQEGPPPDVNALDNDALDALGAAFDSMAMRPSQQRGADGLSDDERRFLRADAPPVEARPPPRKPPPRPPGKPGERRQGPPPRAKKPAGPRPVSKGIALSAEAKDAAFIPLRAPPASQPVASAPPKRTPTNVDEQTVPAASVERENATELLARPKRPAPRQAPTVMGGISKLALAAAVLLGVVGGGVAGAATAPASAKRNDARGRAEAQLAEGNRFYQVGRFDDALGMYKAALNNDRAYAVAHRAKGSALASNKRYDEAAEAYRDYLALEPSAIDAADIKEALARRGLAPVTGGDNGR
jgi:hypothetical protein